VPLSVAMASLSASSRSQHSTRVIIIGAGWSGLAAAKTYLQINPNISLTIIDEDSTVGGVWSSARIYPGLIADSCAAIFDYSDFPMDKELGIDKWADLPAEKVHDYLERYTDKFDLRKRCKLNTKVLGVERDSEKGEEGYVWRLEAETKKDFEEHSVREVLLCDKLIVATGVSSTPSLPDLDWSKFDGPVMHSKEVGKKYKVLTTDPIKRVTVVGGNKSAVEVVYLCALAGIEVDWVIREEGYGPGVLFEARTKGKHAGAIKAARASAIPFPNILATSGFWYWFFHSGKSQVGTFLLKWSLEKFSKKAIKSMYGKNEHTMKAAPDVKK
jgi:dimethylaniline monooxygenase (N-oxide forming)